MSNIILPLFFGISVQDCEEVFLCETVGARMFWRWICGLQAAETVLNRSGRSRRRLSTRRAAELGRRAGALLVMSGVHALWRLHVLEIWHAGYVEDLFVEHRGLVAVVAEKRRRPGEVKRQDCLCVGHHSAQRLERMEDAVRALEDVCVVRAGERRVDTQTPVPHCGVTGERHRHRHSWWGGIRGELHLEFVFGSVDCKTFSLLIKNTFVTHKLFCRNVFRFRFSPFVAFKLAVWHNFAVLTKIRLILYCFFKCILTCFVSVQN